MSNRYQIPYVTKVFKKNNRNNRNYIKNELKEIEEKVAPKWDPAAVRKGVMIVILGILALFLLIIIYMLIVYLITPCYHKKPVLDYLFDFEFNPCIEKEPPVAVPDRPWRHEEKEVFHLNNQDYTYEQAKCKCAAYGGRLATKGEITDAYNKGAEWCSYGWSHGQAAYYPTQKCTWDQLQRGPKKHRWDCGFPGINGGFFANPRLKFGVNCYGVRPEGRLVKEKKPICTGKEFCELQPNYEAAHKLDTDQVAPFNKNQWSKYD